MACVALTLAVLFVCAAPASASELLLRDRVTVASTANSTCSERSHGGAGTARTTLTAPASGYLTARLAASSGDWDLAVFRSAGGEAVAASAYRGATEVASGFVRRGDRLTIRSCRRTGVARRARMSVNLERIAGRRARGAPRWSAWPLPHCRKRRLARLGLDLTENGGPGFVSGSLHGAARCRPPARRGLHIHSRRRGRRPRERVPPRYPVAGRSGTTGVSPAYGDEMKALAARQPRSREARSRSGTPAGRGGPVEGLEITTNPGARDGKPVYLQLGMHHANEWPAAEHPMEWAYELISGYRAGDARTRTLVGRVRTIIVPVMNPDGFNFSREAGETEGHGEGLGAARKRNRRRVHTERTAARPAASRRGVDLNRNYGDLWGGLGSSSSPTSGTELPRHRARSPSRRPRTSAS